MSCRSLVRWSPRPRPSLRQPKSLLVAAALLQLTACRNPPPERSEPAAAPATAPTPPAAASTTVAAPPVDLVRLPESPYRAFLGFSGANLVLVGDAGIHFIAPGEPPNLHACATGTHRSLRGEDVVYYEAGRFFLQSARGGARRPFFAEPIEPKLTASAPGVHLWVTAKGGRERLSARVGSTSKPLYETSDALLAIALDGKLASFVEGKADGAWRIGLVEIGGGEPRLGEFERTRSPASLVTAGVTYYYDGPRRAVRGVPPSLLAAETVAENVICSPLTTARGRVYCAEVGGLTELVHGRTPRQLPVEIRGPVTTLVANEHHLAWLEDAGKAGLVARVFELPE